MKRSEKGRKKVMTTAKGIAMPTNSSSSRTNCGNKDLEVLQAAVDHRRRNRHPRKQQQQPPKLRKLLRDSRDSRVSRTSTLIGIRSVLYWWVQQPTDEFADPLEHQSTGARNGLLHHSKTWSVSH